MFNEMLFSFLGTDINPEYLLVGNVDEGERDMIVHYHLSAGSLALTLEYSI